MKIDETRPCTEVPEPKGLSRKTELHWVHWLVVSLSLLLTFAAWYFTKTQVETKVASQFQREADRVVELISERMQKYEDALWGGVGAIQSRSGDVSYEDWLAFANTLRIERKYPGINGIGVIHHLTPDQVPAYVEKQRVQRADFNIHPSHDRQELFPITFIEPININGRAVGLDIAHEHNRYTAARQARDTGLAQITGPIFLVQDAEQTPGFLFYAPFYRGGAYDSVADRQQNFIGMVYAPFVVKKLMEGTLEKAKRQIGVRISDGAQVLFDEHVSTERDFDPNPMFTRSVAVPLYGRTWSFDIWSARSFNEAARNHQPMTILIGGLLIDGLLLLLFIMLTRSNKAMLEYARYAARAANELQVETERLKRSNADLEQFAYVASHDLQEPLRMVGNFTQLLQRRYQAKLDDKADSYINYAVEGVTRMQTLLNELLQYSRLDSQGEEFSPVDSEEACHRALENLAQAVAESGANVQIKTLPRVNADASQLTQLFQNLIGNALKFRVSERPLEIQVSARARDGDWLFAVNDNGIGIEKQYCEKIFVMFQRLHSSQAFPGVGVGLAICAKVVNRHGGQIWVKSTPGKGSTFYFTLARVDTSVAPGPQLGDTVVATEEPHRRAS